MFLTVDQVRELTGLAQWAAQIRWLRRNGIQHYVRADGRPVVPVSSVSRTETQAARVEPDFAALRRAE